MYHLMKVLKSITDRIRIVLLAYFILTTNFLVGYSQKTVQEKWKPDIKDSDKYDQGFLRYWQYVKPYKLKIINDSIIVNNEINNPIIIPTDYQLSKEFTYKSVTNDTTFKLAIRRLNYTNFHYSINIYYRDKLASSRSGVAILEPTFYLGAEGDFRTNDGRVYKMNDYIIMKDGNQDVRLMIPEGTKEVVYYIDNISNRRVQFQIMKENK
jgi:hypothetical protein